MLPETMLGTSDIPNSPSSQKERKKGAKKKSPCWATENRWRSSSPRTNWRRSGVRGRGGLTKKVIDLHKRKKGRNG